MAESNVHKPPRRVTDLVELKKAGSKVSCEPTFEVLPVDFAHRKHQFQAYVFLCRYSGSVDGQEYLFRKCYARGCPHNLCPHVAQAVMIANRYLLRDFRRLRQGGIDVPETMFTLDDMVVKFEDLKEDDGPVLTIHDYINIANEGNDVSVEVSLESVPAVEHFAGEKNKQTFLNVEFAVTTLGRTGHYQRCLGCYATEREKKERAVAVAVANQRLALLYQEFDKASIKYKKRFFD
jgi:hypothetical protein